jgi:hypothetical protein
VKTGRAPFDDDGPAARSFDWLAPALREAIAWGEDAIDGDRRHAMDRLERLRREIVAFERMVDDLLADEADVPGRQRRAHQAVDALLEAHEETVQAIEAIGVVGPFDRVRAVVTDVEVLARAGSG